MPITGVHPSFGWGGVGEGRRKQKTQQKNRSPRPRQDRRPFTTGSSAQHGTEAGRADKGRAQRMKSVGTKDFKSQRVLQKPSLGQSSNLSIFREKIKSLTHFRGSFKQPREEKVYQGCGGQGPPASSRARKCHQRGHSLGQVRLLKLSLRGRSFSLRMPGSTPL